MYCKISGTFENNYIFDNLNKINALYLNNYLTGLHKF